MRAWPMLLLCAACAGPSWQQVPHDRRFQSVGPQAPHPPPPTRFHSDWWDVLNQGGIRPLGAVISPATYVDMASGPPAAQDTNNFGEVVDSSWFTNRLGRAPMSKEEVARGPDRLEGPAPGPLTVLSSKTEGATPGVVVRDTAGVVFVVKFDPPAFAGMASAAEVISTKVLHAAGYNVPENYIVEFEVSRLVLAPNAVTAGDYGAKVPMDDTALASLINHVNPYPGGTVRALFSRYVDGKPLGPFLYRGSNADDPHDRLPHERRRSLRGLGVFMAWLNNVDTRAENSLDTFIADPADPSVGLIRHWILDFGDALGAAGSRSKVAGEGYQHIFDLREVAKNFFSLGIYYPYWLPVLRSPYRAVGIFESQIFDPARWVPRVPNPAFEQADPLDWYWAASIIARFNPDHLAAIVGSGRYSEPGAAAWVLRVLTERQYRILDHAFSRVLPLEDPTTHGTVLHMRDLAVDATMMLPADSYYTWSASVDDEVVGEGHGERPVAELEQVIAAARSRPGFTDAPFVTVSWRRVCGVGPFGAVHVHLRVLDDRLLVVGVDRDVD